MPINTDGSEFFPSVTADGTIYITRDEAARTSFIYRSRLVDGAYAEPVRLDSGVNSTTVQFNSYVAPDERYLVYGAFKRPLRMYRRSVVIDREARTAASRSVIPSTIAPPGVLAPALSTTGATVSPS